VCILSLFEDLNFVFEVYENVHENEEQMKGEDEGRKIKLDVGSTPLVTMDLCKTNIFLKKLTERTNVTNSYIVKGSK
jgi:predicted DNA-binding protein